MKTNDDTPILSATKMFAMDSSFYRCKNFVDISRFFFVTDHVNRSWAFLMPSVAIS